MTDQELKDLVASLAISQKETDRQIDKTGKQIQELRESQKETDRQLQEADEYLKKSSIEFEKRIKKLEKLVGGIGNNQGDAAEEYFINSLEKKLQIGRIKFDYLVPNYVIKSKRIRDEYDILLVNKDTIAIIEVKYKFHIDDLDTLPKKLANLKQFSPYKNHTIYAGIAGFNIPDDVVEEALKRGYFVLKRSGEVIERFKKELLEAA
jgi:hypothetical protein